MISIQKKYITEGDDDEDNSVFDYFFPGNKKKKPKNNIKGQNYSEKIMNMKREYNDSKGAIRGNHDVNFEDPDSMYKSDKESRRTKTNRSIQPSNPGQSKKSHRRVESQLALHSKGNKDLIKNSKARLSARGKKGKLNAIMPSSVKKFNGGAQTSRAGASAKRMTSRSKSKGKGDKLHKSNQKSHIMNKIAKIEDMKKRQDKQTLDRAMKIHNNQMRKSQKYLR